MTPNSRTRLKSSTRILFLSAFHTPFIQDDIDTLSAGYSVKPLIGHGILQAIRIAMSVPQSDVVFCWFASVYAFVGVLCARISGKKSVIVVGGVDVAKEPELGYGIWLSPWKAPLVRYALRNADRVLVVDESLRNDATTLAAYDGRNIRFLPTGYDSDFWKPKGRKESFVLTVAVVHDERRVRLKGIDLLMQAARQLRSTQFLVVGVGKKAARNLDAPPNVTILDPLRRSYLLPLYRRAKVYCQPSRREGLPNTLCEAMLCGCIPVATDVGGNSHAVGNTGILTSTDASSLAAAIQKALRMPKTRGSRARARAAKLFAKKLRESGLHRLITELSA
ncbi:MAG: glycosyltransferase family 4 protein [Bacteroidota bacterium]